MNRHRDHGFFGPGSVTWRVWSYPTSIILGFARAVVVEELDPFLVASVDQSGQVKQRTRLRYDRTMQYFATVTFGDAESVLTAADTLVKIHSRAVGTEPITGRTYDANDPASQLWIHLTAWHSILYTYEVFGPGKLRPEDEDEYWRQCAVAAECQTIDPKQVPRTREQVAAYFEAYRPHLVGSEVAQDMMDYLLDLLEHVLPERVPGPARSALNAVSRRAVIATLPRWMRKLAGTPQSRATDAATVAAIRPVMRALATQPRRELAILGALSPRTVPILEPVLLGTPAERPVTWTPADAYAHFDRTTPRRQYAQLQADRRAGHGPRPYPRHHHESVLEFPATG